MLYKHSSGQRRPFISTLVGLQWWAGRDVLIGHANIPGIPVAALRGNSVVKATKTVIVLIRLPLSAAPQSIL